VNQPARKARPGTEGASGHALAGGGPSQLGVDGSMRARDVSRPTDDEVATAEKTVQVVRRNPPPPAKNDSAG